MLRTIAVGLTRNFNLGSTANHAKCLRTYYTDIHGSDITKNRAKCAKWKAYNEKVYPPQERNEPRRPAYICHVKEDIKYSYKKMWYIACFIRGMSIDEAIKQLSFLSSKGAIVGRETLLEAQKKAVEEHNVEFKSNLWVSESFVGKSHRIIGFRRCARGRMTKVRYGFVHFFVTLEEGSPPEYYYYHHKKKSGDEMLKEWLEEMRQRKVTFGL